jgi:uncharacterized protein with PIN domain
MSMYECPYCGENILSEDIEEFHGGYGEDETQHFDVTCSHCAKDFEITAEIRVEYTLVAKAGVAPEPKDPDPAVVAAYFRLTPEQVRVDPKGTVCNVCRRPIADCGCTAKDYITAGYRVAQEFPGIRVTCPDCYGGFHERAA